MKKKNTRVYASCKAENDHIQVKDRKFPHVKDTDDMGNEIPCVSTIQANYEWFIERRETLLFKRLSFIELVIIAALLAVITVTNK